MHSATARHSATAVLTRTVSAVALFVGGACMNAKPPATPPAPSPFNDARVGLKAGLMDAGEAISNLKIVSKVASPPGFLGETNSDLTFTGNYAIQGNYNGPVIWDISNPAKPQLVTAYTCPASQNDVSVFRNLMFMSAEAMNGRVDCLPGGVPEAVSKQRFRGVRVFDISDIKHPKLVANVQTCRGSHTHTVLEDPKDKENIYLYVSGSSALRPAGELAGCESTATEENPNSALLRIEIIKVPLTNPAASAVVNRANIFSGLTTTPGHAVVGVDRAANAKSAAESRASGNFTAVTPGTGDEMTLRDAVVIPLLDSIVKARGGSGAPTSADSAALRAAVQGIVNRLYAPGGAIVSATQCHDITVYPALGIAGGACQGHGLLLDISDPVHPMRLDAVADTNFAYWHSATFNNDGTKLLFSDEWGGGRAPKCRATDRPEWGADAIFAIENRKLKFLSYYKIPTAQSDKENCVAHNGSLIPIPGRDVMVQSWYQGGISVFDWTDGTKPKEIAFFDRGPVDATQLVDGGSWSVYWYNGTMVSSEIARGMDITELTPSPYLTQNEIDAAKTVHWNQLNAQGQPKIDWPPSFALARAYVDQLERNKCLSSTRVAAVRQALTNAERASGAQRSQPLQALAGELDGDARNSCDGRKVNMLKKAVSDLASVVM